MTIRYKVKADNHPINTGAAGKRAASMSAAF